MKLTFLGTGTSQGIPVIGCDCMVCKSKDARDKRLRCAAFLQDKDTTLLIDSGPDIRYQSLRSEIQKVNAVLISHEHYDHTGGLDDLRPFMFMQDAPLPLYAQHDVMNTFKIKYDYAFGSELYPGSPRFDLFEIQPARAFKINDTNILPLDVIHGKLHILGFKINDKLAYITDANQLLQPTIDQTTGIDCLVINALHHRPHHSHFTLDETLQVIEKINPRSAYIIHMSHHMGLHADMQVTLPRHVHFAFDMLSVEI